MSHPLLAAFFVFAAVMAFTPGPNNIMVLSSGLTYGLRRTLPHIAGIGIGVGFMVAAVGLGFGAVFAAYPVLHTVLKYAGTAYLIYLAVVIAMSAPSASGKGGGRGPMTFWGAVMFQWVNVKGWVMVIGCITAYAAIAGFPWNIAIQSGLMLVFAALSSLGAGRQFAAAASDRAERGAGVQHRHGGAAVGFALPGLDGRMMPHRAMREKGFP